ELLLFNVGPEMLHVVVEDGFKAIVDPLTLEEVVQVVHHTPSAFPSKRLRPGQEGIDRPLLEEPVSPHMLQPCSAALLQGGLADGRWGGHNMLAPALIPNPKRGERDRDRRKQGAIDRRLSQENLP